MSYIQPWPEGWPRDRQPKHTNPDWTCDTFIGPCVCGSWHQPGEFELRDGQLYRRGELVQTVEDSKVSQ